MKFTDFFWDFDGTLFDTYPRINRAIQNALKALGMQAEPAEIARLSKISLDHALQTLCPERTEELREQYRAFAETEGFDTMRPYAGVLKALQSVCTAGGRNYLYTHRGESSLRALAHYGLAPFFTECMTAETAMAHNFPRKPAPDALRYLMEKHSLSPEDCMMVGDRDIDLDSGRNAGMACTLFDPEHYYDGYATPYRYVSMLELTADLIWEQRPDDLRVSDLLALQNLQQERHPEWGGISPQMTVSKLLWLVGELGEVIDVVKKVPAERLTEPCKARERLVEELADVSMYFHDVLNCCGIGAEEFSRAYYEKVRINLRRDFDREHMNKFGN